MTKARLIMVQGTASSVGKSIIVAALCRIFHQDDHKVAPFKAQNMALNSFITAAGGEIGRAQAVQAEAAGIAPTVDMNPVLLKPAADSGCQVIVLGKVARNIPARDYYLYTPALLETVTAALERLRSGYDIVVIEGAGSPAEINLKDQEIVNMRLARAAAAPVLLVGDIDRGGVFASLVGTLELLDEAERGLVRGLVINKFRGDVSLLQPGLDFLEKRTGKPVLGVVPFFRDIRIAQEDSVYLDERPPDAPGELKIAVIRLPHISNFDDFDPFEEEDGVSVSYVNQCFELDEPDLIIIPGTKSTAADLEYLRHSGLAESILVKARTGTPVVGICGGFQMLGEKILDSQGVESQQRETAGLGLLGVVTEFAAEKSTRQVSATVLTGSGLLAGAAGIEVSGYEIHMGQTRLAKGFPAFHICATPEGPADYVEGSIDGGGMIMGTYLHGLFYSDDFRQVFLNNLRRLRGLASRAGATVSRHGEYDKLADLVRGSLDMAQVYRILEAGV